MRSKADFKALRETLGISQQFMADALDVNIKSVKRWEKPNLEGWYEPPEEAWEILEKYKKIQDWTVRNAIELAEDKSEEFSDINLGAIKLSYYRSQEEFEAGHPNDKGDYQMANATARLVAHDLEQLGYEVEFGFIKVEHF